MAKIVNIYWIIFNNSNCIDNIFTKLLLIITKNKSKILSNSKFKKYSNLITKYSK